MSSRRRRSRRAISRDSIELAMAASEVVAHRLARMWLSGVRPSRRDALEFHRMWLEKVFAFWESWQAMFVESFHANLRLALSPGGQPWRIAPSRPMPPRLGARGRRAVAAVVAAGMAPVHRRAVANAKRLRRVRR